jgi:guanylate kinase
LKRALRRHHPQVTAELDDLVMYNSRAPRPGEVDGQDYHFRSRQQISELRERDGFVVLEVRGDLQAIDMEDLRSCLKSSDVFFEGNPIIGQHLLAHETLQDVPRLGIFMSPVSSLEIADLGHGLEEGVSELMRRKLLRRTQMQKAQLSLPDLQNVEVRAKSACRELGLGHLFDWVIVNHDGEDSDHWSAVPIPIGDARSALRAFVTLLRGDRASGVERWERPYGGRLLTHPLMPQTDLSEK